MFCNMHVLMEGTNSSSRRVANPCDQCFDNKMGIINLLNNELAYTLEESLTWNLDGLKANGSGNISGFVWIAAADIHTVESFGIV